VDKILANSRASTTGDLAILLNAIPSSGK